MTVASSRSSNRRNGYKHQLDAVLGQVLRVSSTEDYINLKLFVLDLSISCSNEYTYTADAITRLIRHHPYSAKLRHLQAREEELREFNEIIHCLETMLSWARPTAL